MMIPRPSITELWEAAGGDVYATRARCPFHTDKVPSASVDEDEGRWACYACDISGDQITFIQHWKGVGFPEAVTIAGQFAGPESAPPRSEFSPGYRNRRPAKKWHPPWL